MRVRYVQILKSGAILEGIRVVRVKASHDVAIVPSKSEIMSLAFSKTLNVDEIMLSDETATSKNYDTTIK